MPLRHYSLVQVSDDKSSRIDRNGDKFSKRHDDLSEETFAVHRLVQTIVRDRMTDAARKTFAQAAATIVNNAFPFDSDDVRTWDVCTRLLSHALASADHAAVLHVAPKETGRLFNQVALHLQVRAQFADAKQLLERAVAVYEAALGSDHPNTKIVRENLEALPPPP